MVHDDAQLGREPRGLGRPVADDGRRRDHERRAGARAREQAGQHRRRLAEAHVEREAAAEADGVEEAEPRERFGLVAAQLADEAVGHARLGAREIGRRLEQVGRPAGTGHRDATRERAAFEAEREAQHLAARELRLLRTFGERGRGLRRRDRSQSSGRRMKGRASFASLAMSAAVSSTSSNTADQRTSASWFAPTAVVDAVSAKTRSEALGLRRESAGMRTSNREELRPGRSHHLPGLVGAEDDLTAAGSAGTHQRGHESFEPRDLVLEVAPVGAGVDDRLLDRHEGAAPSRCEHREMPGVGGVGRIETHDQPRVLTRHRAAPTFDPRRDLTAESQGRVEGTAVEAREERLGDVRRGADAGRRCGNRAARAFAADGVDHAGERGTRERGDRPSWSSANKLPGIDLGHASRRAGAISPGVQRTEYAAGCGVRTARPVYVGEAGGRSHRARARQPPDRYEPTTGPEQRRRPLDRPRGANHPSTSPTGMPKRRRSRLRAPEPMRAWSSRVWALPRLRASP